MDITLGLFAFALLDVVAVDVIFTIFFTIDDKHNIKRTFGDSLFKSTGSALVAWLVITVGYFFVSNMLQDSFVNWFNSFGNKLIGVTAFLFGFLCFWFVKVTVGRRWEFPLVIASIVIMIVGVLLAV